MPCRWCGQTLGEHPHRSQADCIEALKRENETLRHLLSMTLVDLAEELDDAPSPAMAGPTAARLAIHAAD